MYGQPSKFWDCFSVSPEWHKKKRVGWGGNDTRQMGSEEQSEDACILISGDPDFVLTENDRSKGCDSDVDIMLF